MNFGKVRSFHENRGFGFLVSKDGDHYFVHRTRINRPGYRTLTENEEVTFDVENDATGLPRAVNVTPLDKGVTR